MTKCLFTLLCLCLMLACGNSSQSRAQVPPSPIEPSVESCAACGMVIHEQPSPRAQLIHRDGTRAFFCSPADLLVYLAAPSPHGAATDIFLEAIQLEGGDLKAPELQVKATGWKRAEELHYIKGIERKDVMGEPILSFAKLEEASSLLNQAGITAHSWDQLRAKP